VSLERAAVQTDGSGPAVSPACLVGALASSPHAQNSSRTRKQAKGLPVGTTLPHTWLTLTAATKSQLPRVRCPLLT